MLLFVYGTLRSGFINAFRHLMESKSTLIAAGSMRGRLYDLGSYPGLILSDDPNDQVYGEVYLVHEVSLIKELDMYEDYRENDDSSLYLRTIEKIISEKGEPMDAIVYIYNKSIDKAINIKGGDYIKYLARKPID